jgi:DMSO/TMAO reductase YedYZ molybdopterin-dependent catalytic subunit
VAKFLTRRGLVLGATSAAFLAGCKSHPIAHFLDAMKVWNTNVEGVLFSPNRLAPEFSLSQRTPENAFPSYFISDSMPFPSAKWSLKVAGLVDRPVVLTLGDLRRMPRTDVCVQHHCVEGWSAIASWQGVRLSEVAKVVGVSPAAKFVEFRSFDSGYWSSWDRGSALHPQTLLAYGMNGHSLYPDHGAPLRLYSGVKLGYKSVKYLTQINFLPHKTGGYWENQGYEWFAGV